MQQLDMVSGTPAVLQQELVIRVWIGDPEGLGVCMQIAQLQRALPSSLQDARSSQTRVTGQDASRLDAADILLEARTHAAALMQVAAKLQQTLKCDQQQPC